MFAIHFCAFITVFERKRLSFGIIALNKYRPEVIAPNIIGVSVICEVHKFPLLSHFVATLYLIVRQSNISQKDKEKT